MAVINLTGLTYQDVPVIIAAAPLIGFLGGEILPAITTTIKGPTLMAERPAVIYRRQADSGSGAAASGSNESWS